MRVKGKRDCRLHDGSILEQVGAGSNRKEMCAFQKIFRKLNQ